MENLMLRCEDITGQKVSVPIKNLRQIWEANGRVMLIDQHGLGFRVTKPANSLMHLLRKINTEEQYAANQKHR